MLIKTFFVNAFCLILLSASLSAQQGFDLWAVGGFNAAQIAGDGLAGYDKIGFQAGLKLAYPLEDKWELDLEILFAQKGSRASTAQLLMGSRQTTSLDYLELPVYVTYNDWYQESEGYYKVGLHAGLSAGYLFSAKTRNSLVVDQLENFKDFDYSAIIGAFYAFNKRWSVTVRYTNSFIKIYKNENLTTEGLLNFLWTFRADFRF